jgi:RNA polymerase sigma-70 factor (ECF subfamily)
VTDSQSPPHSMEMLGVASLSSADAPQHAARPEVPPFEAVYDTYFPYIWRSVQRLGVPAANADDVVQEVFIVVHRKLGEFEGRSTLKTWLYGVALHVARAHRARLRRAAEGQLDSEHMKAPDAARPDEQAASAEAARLVNSLLDGLDDDQREVFVLTELEQLSAPEIADALGVKLNTVYSRLRLGRAAFAEAAARHRAREGWRTR